MSTDDLERIADSHGIASGYSGPDGRSVPVSEETRIAILKALGVDRESGAQFGDGMPVLRAPEDVRCYLPSWLEHDRAWGIAVQLYEIRSQRNWGIGDFADLAEFSRVAARAGADYVGVNPLHALFLAEPERCSPFSPSNRLFLNPLYIAVDALPFAAATAEEEVRAALLRATDLVDYRAVAALKIPALRKAFGAWKSLDEVSGYSWANFEAFLERGGEALRRHALFECLSAHMAAQDHGGGWEDWPAQYRDVVSHETAEFARQRQDDITFHAWLQWIADKQLGEAAAAGRDAGLRIGLYIDCAVGDAPDGSATWMNPALSLPSLSIGAPPDYFTAEGQNWGLAPLSPAALKAAHLAPFRAMIAASLRHAGAMRIDHVMSLWQLFFVPRGGKPADGAYVRYPAEDMLRVVAEESQEHQAVVIGEDLGYVPEGFRPVMHAAGVLSYRILYFEQGERGFASPSDYPRLAMACLATHDLPTFIGWWRADDAGLRFDHGLIDEAAADAQSRDRAASRHSIISAFEAAGLLRVEDRPAFDEAANHPRETVPEALIVAAHRFVAATESLLATVRLADLAGDLAPTNLPGTVDSYPNWRPKSRARLETIGQSPLFTAICRAMGEERPRRS